jgi:hypothetical protein
MAAGKKGKSAAANKSESSGSTVTYAAPSQTVCRQQCQVEAGQFHKSTIGILVKSSSNAGLGSPYPL